MHCKQEIDILKHSTKLVFLMWKRKENAHLGDTAANERHFCKNGIALFKEP